jgi:hypothetical protein
MTRLLAGSVNPSNHPTSSVAGSGTGSDGRAVALQANPFPYLAGFKAIGDSELTDLRHGYARLYGAITPAEAGSRVIFQLLRPGRQPQPGDPDLLTV